jgi:hypothetical protein
MTPKGKAIELMNKMYFVSELNGICLLTIHSAKQCALIAVDEIINVIEDNCLEYDDNYWQEVKQEIEKL